MNAAKILLEDKGLKITQTRVQLLSLFMKEQKGYSLADLNSLFNKTLDRITIYRTLKAFHKAGIITTLKSKSRSLIYIFESAVVDQKTKISHHLHCTTCDKVIELPNPTKDYLTLLEKYQIEKADILLEGTCINCTHINLLN